MLKRLGDSPAASLKPLSNKDLHFYQVRRKLCACFFMPDPSCESPTTLEF